MRQYGRVVLVIAFTGVWGCLNDAPPPHRVPVPATSNRDQVRPSDYVKPMPEREEVAEAPRRSEPPPVREREVETRRAEAAPAPRDEGPSQVEKDFLDAYEKVGRPRVIVFVNRTLDGQIVPVAPDGSGSPPPAERREYLRPGQYDEANAHAVDYQAFENRLTERLGMGGKVTVISPEVVREKVGEAGTKELQNGRAAVLSDLDRKLGADVLIQVQMRPTKQTSGGLEFRVVAEAINVNGGQSIGHAFADVSPPLDGAQLRGAARYLSEELMGDMIQSWSRPGPNAGPGPSAVPPVAAPARTSGPNDAPPAEPAKP